MAWAIAAAALIAVTLAVRRWRRPPPAQRVSDAWLDEHHRR